MLRQIVLAAALTFATAALADDDAKMCALGVTQVHDQAETARALLDAVRAFLPDNVEAAALKGDSVDQSIAEIRKELPASVSGEVAELANSAVKILPLLQDFVARSEAAETVVKACAGTN